MIDVDFRLNQEAVLQEAEAIRLSIHFTRPLIGMHPGAERRMIPIREHRWVMDSLFTIVVHRCRETDDMSILHRARTHQGLVVTRRRPAISIERKITALFRPSTVATHPAINCRIVTTRRRPSPNQNDTTHPNLVRSRRHRSATGTVTTGHVAPLEHPVPEPTATRPPNRPHPCPRNAMDTPKNTPKSRPTPTQQTPASPI